jgi:hypothetical protein
MPRELHTTTTILERIGFSQSAVDAIIYFTRKDGTWIDEYKGIKVMTSITEDEDITLEFMNSDPLEDWK